MKFATIISRVLDPYILLTILIVLALIKSTLPIDAKILGGIIGAVVVVAVPIVLSLWAIRTKRLINWDAQKREERPKLFLFILLYECIILVIIRQNLDQLLYHTFFTFLVAFAGFSCITLLFKISGHAFVNAFVSGFIISWFGWSFYPVLGIVFLVSWSRVMRGNHTVPQVVLGALYGWMAVILSRFV